MMLQYRIAEHTEHLIIREGGQIVVPARYFIDIIRNSSLEELVSLALTDDGVICIKTGSAVYRLCGMPADEFPQIAEMQQPDLAGIPNDKLRALIGQVAFAVSGSQTRPVLTGVRCHFSGEGLRLLATDGIRLASCTMPVNAELQPDRSAVVVPGSNLLHYAKLLSDAEAATDISYLPNKIIFRTMNLMMQSSLIEGTYPSVDRLTPEAAYSTVITVDSGRLLGALERVTLLAGESSLVRMRITSCTTLELLSQTAEIGDVIEEMSLDTLVGDRIDICFNGTYMKDILKAAGPVIVQLSFTGPWKPIIIQPQGSIEALYILTPIRAHLQRHEGHTH
jgi:DNA polymerase-3 subunit beta